MYALVPCTPLYPVELYDDLYDLTKIVNKQKQLVPYEVLDKSNYSALFIFMAFLPPFILISSLMIALYCAKINAQEEEVVVEEEVEEEELEEEEVEEEVEEEEGEVEEGEVEEGEVEEGEVEEGEVEEGELEEGEEQEEEEAEEGQHIDNFEYNFDFYLREAHNNN
jgi:flagellar biosynthesis component FlhA